MGAISLICRFSSFKLRSAMRVESRVCFSTICPAFVVSLPPIASVDVEVRALVLHAQVSGDGVSSPQEDRQPVLFCGQLHAGK